MLTQTGNLEFKSNYPVHGSPADLTWMNWIINKGEGGGSRANNIAGHGGIQR